MYINAFKNFNSTFLKGTDGQIFGRDFSTWPKENFGWIEINQVGDQWGNDLTPLMKYIQPDDGNPDDQSVIQIDLIKPILPHDSIVLQIEFEERLPRILVRSGWAPNDYFAFLHWFPQMGVFEQKSDGTWGWNCHQFFRTTEFFADFGVYDVSVHLDEKFIVGATGCQTKRQIHGDGSQTIEFHAEDVIDFAWIAYPEFEEFTDRWNHVAMRTLTSPAHASLAPRFTLAVKQVLEAMTKIVGEFPYPSITIVDPPIQGLNSGFMEYPMLITVGSFYQFPKNIRSIESLAMHEFLHQYFMGIVATNEKEEPWLDEGFVTYFEDRILDELYGENNSYIDILGYQTGNAEFSRLEYTSLEDPEEFPIATLGWNITGARKGIIYGKTGVVLKTLENIIGQSTMDEIMRTYFQQWKFSHPRGHDFIKVVNEVVNEVHGDKFGENLNWFFDRTVYSSASCDYKVNYILDDQFEVERVGDLMLPVEVEVTFEDGSTIIETWSTEDRIRVFANESTKNIQSVHIDPAQKILLDLNLNNNSLTIKPSKMTLWKYVLKAVFWTQNTFQTIGMML
jgi:aminopeptidase N